MTRKLTPAAQESAVHAVLSDSWQSAMEIAKAMAYRDVSSVKYRLKRMAAAGTIDTDHRSSVGSPTNVYRRKPTAGV